MLSETIKHLRKEQNLSQAQLAEKLHVVRQTVSKWEQGYSVPDADMLIRLSEVFQVPVSTLLGETPAAPEAEAPTVEALAQELARLNAVLAKRQAVLRRKRLIGFGCVLGAGILILALLLYIHIQELKTISSLGIIGGADGPTAILVATAGPGILPYVLAVALILCGIVGLIRNRRK